MTNKEAISVLESINAKTDYFLINDDARAEAIDMAISSLQVQDVPDTNVGDTVSRQAAINALCRRCDLAADDDEPCTDKCNDIKILEKMPSVQQEAISLEWIDKHLEWLDNCDNDFAQLAKVGIRAMVEIWKKDKT